MAVSIILKLVRYFQIRNAIEEAFKDGHIKAVLFFQNDFSTLLEKERSAAIQVITDATDPNTANTINNYVQSILVDYQGEYSPQHQSINVATRMQYNSSLKSCVYVCSRSDDGYFNACFCNDDFHFYYKGKGVGNYGNIIGFPIKILSGNYREGNTLYFFVANKCSSDYCNESVCF